MNRVTKKNNRNKKKSFITIFSLLFVLNPFLLAQPSVDSIRYNLVDQSILLIYCSENVSYTATYPTASPDWEVNHGGLSYASVSLMNRSVFDLGNVIRLKLSSEITYSEANEGITVDYFGTGPPISGTSGNLDAFSGVIALNTLPFNCNIFKLDFGVVSNVDKTCSPITVSNLSITYNLKPEYQNSIHYDYTRLFIRIDWGDGGVNTAYPLFSDPDNSILSASFTHIYPDDPNVCLWNATARPAVRNLAYCTGGGLQQDINYLNYSTDDEGSGVLQMNSDTIRVCLGQDFNVSFQDATLFNCRKEIEETFPNIAERWVQFSYGTNYSAEPRIQDVLIEANSVAFPYTPSPPDNLFFYDSADTPFPNATSLMISHAADLTTDQIGQVFEIKLDNWGPCNDIFLGEDPVTTYSYIKIVDGPIANAGPDFTICADDDATMAGAIERTATAGVWSTNTGDGSWTNPNLPAGAIYTPGANDIINGGVWLVLTADDGAAGCPEHQDSMFLSIDPVITNNTLTDNDEDFCDNGDPSLINGAAASGGDGDITDDYQWQQRTTGGWTNIPGATNQDYDPDPITETTRYRRVINSGECTSVSNVITVEVYEPPTVDAGSPQTICSNTTANLNGSIGGGASSATWTTSGDGSFDDATDLAAAYDPGPNDISSGTVTLTLTTNDPTGPCTPVSEDVIITVIEDVTVDAGPAGEVCSSDTYTLSGATLSGDYSTITWSTSGDGSFNNTGDLNPIYTPGPGDVTSGSVQLTISINSDAPCGNKSDNMTLTVNQQPVVDAGSSPTICEGTSYTVSNATASGDYSALTWTTSGDGAFTAGQGTVAPTYAPGPNDAIAGNVTLTLTATAAGSCEDDDDDMIITIEPAVDPGIIAGSQSLCAGEDAAPLTSVAPATGGVALT